LRRTTAPAHPHDSGELRARPVRSVGLRAPRGDCVHQPHGEGAPRLMATSVTTQAPARRIGGGPTRSVAAASWTALGALLLRDLVVLRKHLWEFVLRTIIQPFLLCFVFLYVFPKIGQG